MLGIVEGAFTARTAAEPTTPVVVSVPHAGVAHGRLRGDADAGAGRARRRRSLRRSPLPHRRARGARDLRGGAALALRLRSQPRSRRRRAGRRPRAPDRRATPTGAASSGRSRPAARRRWPGRSRCASGAGAPRSTPPTTRRSRARSPARATSSGSRSSSTGTRCRRAAAPATPTPDACGADVVPGDREGHELLARAAGAGHAPLRGRAASRCSRTIRTRAASSPPTTAAPPTRSTPSRSSCGAISTWTRRSSPSPSRGSTACAACSPGCSPSCAASALRLDRVRRGAQAPRSVACAAVRARRAPRCTPRYFSITTLRLTLSFGVSSPAASVKSCGRMAEPLDALERRELPVHARRRPSAAPP